jgi:hypothetical protein
MRGHPTRVSIVYVPTAGDGSKDERGQVALLTLFKLMQETWPR